MGVSILSFADGVQFGLITAASLVPDPQRIADRMSAELERLVLLALMEPWDWKRAPATVEQEILAASRPLRASGKPRRRRQPRASTLRPAAPAPAAPINAGE
jgi:hypothetical protein